MSTAIATQYRVPWTDSGQDARRKRETGTARAHELASNWGDTLTHTLVVEPYSSDQVQTGALQAVFYSVNLVMCSLASCRIEGTFDVGRGRETHAHCY